MRSGGFGLGKKQTRGDEIRRVPPSSSDLTQLLTSSQKSPEKVFTWAWQASDNQNIFYTLTVVNSNSNRDRRGWSANAIDNGALGEAEWKLNQDKDNLRTEIFSMKCSDAYLIQTLLDEAMATGAAPFTSGAGTPPPAAPQGKQPLSSNTITATPTPGILEGNLRQTPIRALLESFNVNKTTGRLIVDIGTVQSEVFLTAGEPVHAKSSHSISQGRDTLGDASLIDLLTWKDGTYKFQEGWPAASKSITNPLSDFLAGTVTAAAPQPTPSTTTPSPASGGHAESYQIVVPQASTSARVPRPPFTAVPGSPDDFATTDDLIGATFSALVDPAGLIQYGMLLMLTRSEFIRFEKSQIPFCFACIEMTMPPGAQFTMGALTKIGERFEKVCQPLDTLSFAGGTRFFALFPQANVASAEKAVKLFLNNIVAIPLDTGLHGSGVKFTVGLAEMPRDGDDFQEIFEYACALRQQATPEKKIVTAS